MTLDLLTSDAFTAIISAIFGGAGVKIIDQIISHRSEYLNENNRMRGELREQIDTLNTALEDTQSSADEWRTKYWHLFEDEAQLKSQIANLRGEADQLHAQIKDLLLETERIKKELNPPETP